MSIVLYAATAMSSATPIQHAFAELDLPHEEVLFDLTKTDHKTPEFLAKNPNGRVPTVVIDGVPMFEALAIFIHLGETYGVQRGLWPAAATPERMQALSWCAWGYVTMASAFQRFNQAGSERVPAELHHPGQRERAREEIDALVAILDRRLAGHPWVLGDSFTLVDICLGGAVGYATMCGIALDGHEKVEAWLHRLFARPSSKKIWAPAAA